MTDHRNEIAGKVVIVTGAAGGIGRSLVAALIEAGAAEVIAAMRRATPVQDPRVRPVAFDIADAAEVDAFALSLDGGADILINNAGFNSNSGALSASTVDGAWQEMRVNYFGTLNMIRAVAPGMKRRGRGIILNMLTVLSHVNLPLMGSYCASKAAAFSLTQAARAELGPAGIRVLGMFPGAVDTAMSPQAPPPKLSPRQVAEATIGLINSDEDDCYPGEMARGVRASLQADMKKVERQFALRLPKAG
jgi:NAD(P)-dependent dehydrogenase (short-subunit alcohol dehydrogenase family)